MSRQQESATAPTPQTVALYEAPTPDPAAPPAPECPPTDNAPTAVPKEDGAPTAFPPEPGLADGATKQRGRRRTRSQSSWNTGSSTSLPEDRAQADAPPDRQAAPTKEDVAAHGGARRLTLFRRRGKRASSASLPPMSAEVPTPEPPPGAAQPVGSGPKDALEQPQAAEAQGVHTQNEDVEGGPSRPDTRGPTPRAVPATGILRFEPVGAERSRREASRSSASTGSDGASLSRTYQISQPTRVITIPLPSRPGGRSLSTWGGDLVLAATTSAYQTGASERARFAPSRTPVPNLSTVSVSPTPTPKTPKAFKIQGPKPARALFELTLSRRLSLGKRSPLPTSVKCGIAAFTFTIIGLLIFLLLPSLFDGKNGGAGTKFCDNADCTEHVKVLALRDGGDRVRPCDDFGSFVCAGVEDRHTDIVEGIVSQVLFEHISKFAEGDASIRDTIFGRSVKVMEKCLDSTTRNNDTLHALLEFVRDKSFRWPTEEDAAETRDPRDYSRPLLALVELAVNWSLPLWFRLELLPSGSSNGRVIRISSSSLGYAWSILHQYVAGNDEIYEGYLDHFNVGILAHRKPTAAFHSFLTRGHVIHGHVVGNLSTILAEPLPELKLLKLRDIPSHVRSLTLGDWMNVLQTVFNARPPFSPDDDVLVADKRILTAMDTLMTAYTARDILFQTSWWFLQIVGPISSDVVVNVFDLYQHLGRDFMTMLCAIHCETVYYALLSASGRSKFSSRQRDAIFHHLNSIQSAAIDKVRSSTTIRNNTKERVLYLLRATENVIWPQGSLSTEEGLESYYGPAYNGSGGIYGQWISSRRHLQQFMVTPEDNEVAKVYRLNNLRLTSYDPLLNVVSISLAALDPPIYYHFGTSAMTYGGLGFVYAMEVATALHFLTAPRSDENDTHAPIGAPQGNALWDTSSCSDPGAVFPELLALSLAYEAYRQNPHASDLPLRGLAYSPRQVFFLTFCHNTCLFYKNKTKASLRCTEAAKNFKPFAEAFSCPLNSAMNPGTRCRHL